MHTIELTDIRVKAALPLDPYLAEHPCLILRLIADQNVCGETSAVNGDLATGVWEFNARLYAHTVKQSLTIAVVAGINGAGIQVVSVTLKVEELVARVNSQPNGYQDIDMFDPSAPIQLKLVMTCFIDSPSIMRRSPQAVGDENCTVDRLVEDFQSLFELEKPDLPSRQDLESLYREPRRDVPAYLLSLLGEGFYALYREKGAKADLQQAVSMHERAVQCTPSFHPQFATHTHRLALVLAERFKQSGELADIERAISHYHTVLGLTGDLDEDKPKRLSNLGNALTTRFRCMGDPDDIENSIACHRKAVDLTPDGHPGKPILLNNLGNAIQSRWERLGNFTEMEDTISNLRKAVMLVPDGHPDKPSLFGSLANALGFRFRHHGELADIEEAISVLQRVVDTTPNTDPYPPSILGSLGTMLHQRFKRLGVPSDLDKAILALQKVVDLAPNGHPEPCWLSGLGIAFQSRFGSLGILADIDAAISNLRQAIDVTPDSHPGRSDWLCNLGVALHSRFERFGDLTDVEEAISDLQEAIGRTPDGHPHKPNQFSNLGVALESRFEHLGLLADMDDAISSLQKAIELTPNFHPDKPALFNNLGIAFESRFKHLGSVVDMDDAISSLRKAVEFTPDGHSDKPSRFNNLGVALQTRFGRLGNLADLEEAISGLQQAIPLTSDGHPYKPILFSNLGIALVSRFKSLDGPADIKNAISYMQEAVVLTPDDHPDKSSLFSSLAIAVQSRFKRTGSHADMNDAISNHQKAVEITPDGHPYKPSWLSNLGTALIIRFGCLSNADDLENGLLMLSTAANSSSGSPMVRFEAARFWAKTADKNSRSPLEAFGRTIDLLPRVAWLGLSMSAQHAHLAKIGGIVRDAVTAAIRAEEYETAVVWAEQGRSIVWQNLLGLRSPIDDLRVTHPQLADRLQNIARRMEMSGSHDALRNEVQTVPMEAASRKYSKLAVEWERIVEEIRGIPKFEGFLRAKSFSQLAPAAHEGPIVILNVNSSQCDALVLIADPSDVRHVFNVPLARFSYEKGEKLFQDLRDLLSSAGVRERNERKTRIAGSKLDGEAMFKAMLRTLWQDVVKPVIEGLAFQTESKRPPRIWWCATGLLAFLPIHAAGLYDTQETGEKVSDYVVSSYTPTLTAILELSEPAVREDFQVLMVAQPSAPGAPPIPKTEDEVRVIRHLTAGSRQVGLTKENATVKSVQDGMRESNWIHLACHGHQNPDNPMESGFLLHDKSLKLSELIKISLPKADFAFLSACQTAMGDEKVAEESVHLAAGMLLLGCRGVIATTWSIRDEDAPKIAQEVYSRIFRDGKPNRKEAAYALHEAVKRLRESGAQCISWVPFIHIGR